MTQRPTRWTPTQPLRVLWRVVDFISPLAPDEALTRTAWAVAGLFLTIGVGVIGYVALADFSPFDALYQTVLTLTTVGFQEVHPLNQGARLFTIFLMLFGVGIVLYLLAAIATLMFEGDLYRDIEGRRTRRMIDNLAGHTIIVGVGLMGSLLLERLVANGETVVAVEEDPAAAEAVSEHTRFVVEGDGAQPEVLQRAGIHQARQLIVFTGDDPTNVFVTLKAVEVAPELRIVARANDPRSKASLLGIGAEEVVSPAELMAEQLDPTPAD